jgi:hypothetical protein
VCLIIGHVNLMCVLEGRVCAFVLDTFLQEGGNLFDDTTPNYYIAASNEGGLVPTRRSVCV